MAIEFIPEYVHCVRVSDASVAEAPLAQIQNYFIL